MKLFLRTLFIFLPFTILVLFAACKKKVVNPIVSIQTITIKDEGTFKFQPNLTYAVIDSTKYEINLKTNPTDADVFYSFNNGEIHQKTTEYIQIDSNVQFISFFATASGVCMDGNNRLDFGYANDSLKSTVTLFPNPTDSIIHFTFESNLRGKLQAELFNVTGVKKFSSNYFLDENILQDSVDLSSLNNGVYIQIFSYGNSKNIKKIVKN